MTLGREQNIGQRPTLKGFSRLWQREAIGGGEGRSTKDTKGDYAVHTPKGGSDEGFAAGQ